MTPDEKNEKLKNDPRIVHSLLIGSYFVYFIPVIFGLLLDILFPGYLFKNDTLQLLGIFIIFMSSMLIFWAQRTSSSSKKKLMQEGVRNFAAGPYKYSRNPTFAGLFYMTIGLGLILGSYFVIGMVMVAFILNKYIFIPKQEHILDLKYGQIYSEYKKKVKSWL